MRQVAEFLVAEGIVAQILNHRAAISVGMSFLDLVFGHARKAFDQERPNLRWSKPGLRFPRASERSRQTRLRSTAAPRKQAPPREQALDANSRAIERWPLRSNQAEEEEDEENQEDKPNPAGRIVSPVSAVRPRGNTPIRTRIKTTVKTIRSIFSSCVSARSVSGSIFGESQRHSESSMPRTRYLVKRIHGRFRFEASSGLLPICARPRASRRAESAG